VVLGGQQFTEDYGASQGPEVLIIGRNSSEKVGMKKAGKETPKEGKIDFDEPQSPPEMGA